MYVCCSVVTVNCLCIPVSAVDAKYIVGIQLICICKVFNRNNGHFVASSNISIFVFNTIANSIPVMNVTSEDYFILVVR